MKVYLVSFEHRHGTDNVVTATEELAVKALLDWVREWREEFEVPEAVTDEQAMANWGEHTGHTESIYFNVMPVIS
jgi:hypothetical protein